jgi:hypothetical protein
MSGTRTRSPVAAPKRATVSELKLDWSVVFGFQK